MKNKFDPNIPIQDEETLDDSLGKWDDWVIDGEI